MASLLLGTGNQKGLLQSVAMINSPNAFSMFSGIASIATNLPNALNDIRDGIIPKPLQLTSRSIPTGDIDVNINVWENNTYERIERNINRYSVVNVFRLCGLVSMYEHASNQNYLTTAQIDKMISTLDKYYDALIENSITDIIVSDIKPQIDKVKILTNQVLKSRRQKAYNVIEINVEKPYPSKLLTYELYGEKIKNEDQLNYLASLIRGLNQSQPAHALQGNIKVLESR
jgi:hypothetical protein